MYVSPQIVVGFHGCDRSISDLVIQQNTHLSNILGLITKPLVNQIINRSDRITPKLKKFDRFFYSSLGDRKCQYNLG